MTQLERVKAAVEASWSIRSSSLWSEAVPSAGQCGVSALVVHDILGGVILKTRLGPIWHFYNQIDGVRHDFTDAQFAEPITYDDLPSSREEAFGDTNASQYGFLSRAVAENMSGTLE